MEGIYIRYNQGVLLVDWGGMGSSSSEQQNAKAIDASVGGLVWVRRRNGSWWPGRIMGLDEISESCLASPNSGTPIKLLGRDDASVDWYNLEKSRHVKPFHCGDYDACIEKAKAAAANPSKRVVKYARREDAIIHALELESAYIFKECHNNNSSMDISDTEHRGSWHKGSPHTSEHCEDGACMSDETSDFEENSNSPQELSHSGISYEETYEASAPKEQSAKGKTQRTPNDSEDEGGDGIKHMRGLNDLGVGSDRMDEAGGLNEAVQQGSVSPNNLCAINSMSIGSLVNGSRGTMPSLKRKRSQVVHVHEFLKRKHRRRPLTKVLEGLVTVPIMFDESGNINRLSFQGASDGRVYGLESNESKKSFSMVINNNSDSTGVSCENGNAAQHPCNIALTHFKLKDAEISSAALFLDDESLENLFDVPIIFEELHSAGFSSLRPHTGGSHTSQNCHVEVLSSRNRAFCESGSTSSTAKMNNVAGTSKWQLKGKRNSRYSSKTEGSKSRKFLDVNDDSNVCMTGIEHMDRFSPSSSGKTDGNPICGSMTMKTSLKDEQADGFTDRQKHPSVRGSLLMRSTDEKLLPDSSSTSQRTITYRQSRFTLHLMFEIPDVPMRGMHTDSVLYDVNIEVKESYRPQRVPYISLMSKLNCKPIIGHPVVVETVEDGYCDSFLDNVDSYPTSSSGELDDEDKKIGCTIKQKAECERPPTKHVKLQKHLVLRKPSKMKKHGFLSKKTRKLSSLTGSQKLSHVLRKPLVQNFKGPALACIPVKVVFSRINEALNGLLRLVNRPLPSNNV
ncbi:hypothetical protein Ancab_029713 [Ancistrocladus abbreviatus]